MKFLNTAEKIKDLRKRLKMKQEDLVDDNITRGFISMIETGKRGFSRDTAEAIFIKFKNKAEKLGVELNEDLDYILRDDMQEAEFYCTQRLKDAEKTNCIDEIISIAKEYQLQNILSDSYMYLGEIDFNKNEYINAHINYMNALSYCKNSNIKDKEPYLYNKLGHCKLNTLQFLEALDYFNLANYYANLQNDDTIRRMSTYNIALCNKKLNRIDSALEYINIYLSICNKDTDFTLYVYSNVLKSICYETKSYIDISISILIELLKEFGDTEDPLICYVYNNLGNLYLKKCDFENSLNYYNKTQKIRESKNIDTLSHTLIEKANVYIKQNLYKQAVALLEEGLALAHKNTDIEYLVKGYYMLADIYIKSKRNMDVQKVYEILADLLKKYDNKNELMKVSVKMAQLYLEQSNYNKLQETLLVMDRLMDV